MSHDLTIAPATGTIHVRGIPLALQAGVKREDVAAAFAPLLRDTRDHHNGYVWLNLQGLQFGGRPAGMGVCFHEGRLTEVHWEISLREESAGWSWPTREESDREVACARATLRTMLDRPFTSGNEKFPWGEVWSDYNARDDCASSGLRYATR